MLISKYNFGTIKVFECLEKVENRVKMLLFDIICLANLARLAKRTEES